MKSHRHASHDLYTLVGLAKAIGIPQSRAHRWKEKGLLQPHPDHAEGFHKLYPLPTQEQLDRARGAAPAAWRANVHRASRVKAAHLAGLLSLHELAGYLRMNPGTLKRRVAEGIVPVAKTSQAGKQRWFEPPGRGTLQALLPHASPRSRERLLELLDRGEGRDS